MNRNYLAGTSGDDANAVLAAAGYNFRLLVLWLSLLRVWLAAIIRSNPMPSTNRQVA